MPILTGVIASGISGNLSPAWSPEGAYDALYSVTLSGNAASVTITGIPTNQYKHLQIRGVTRDTRTGTTEQSVMAQFNGDTGSNYSIHLLEGYGSGTPSAGANTSSTQVKFSLSPTASSTTNTFGAFITDIYDYADNTKFKTVRSVYGNDQNGSGTAAISSGLWMNLNSITSITIYPTNSMSFVANSSFALYGVK